MIRFMILSKSKDLRVLFISLSQSPPAHNSGIYDAAPPLKIRDLRLASNN